MNEYSKYFLLKSSIEDLFGIDAWRALKETNSIPVWKMHLNKVLGSIKIAIHETVKVCDDDWLTEIDEAIDSGIKALKATKSIDDAISVLAGVLIQISFLQIGYMPRRRGKTIKVSLKPTEWSLDLHRTVAYVQTANQKEKIFWGKQQKDIGFENQTLIHDKYRKSRSKLPYSIWCSKNREL